MLWTFHTKSLFLSFPYAWIPSPMRFAENVLPQTMVFACIGLTYWLAVDIMFYSNDFAGFEQIRWVRCQGPSGIEHEPVATNFFYARQNRWLLEIQKSSSMASCKKMCSQGNESGEVSQKKNCNRSMGPKTEHGHNNIKEKGICILCMNYHMALTPLRLVKKVVFKATECGFWLRFWLLRTKVVQTCYVVVRPFTAHS